MVQSIVRARQIFRCNQLILLGLLNRVSRFLQTSGTTMACHHHPESTASADPRYRRVLWIALALNAAMFGIEIVGGARSGSLSLLADAMDFAGDAANYAVSLFALGMGLVARSRVALLKAGSMALFGIFILGQAIWQARSGVAPDAVTMSLIGVLALVVNVTVAVLLFSFREGDADMRSVWLCSRNDALGNLAVIAAAAGVFGTASAWPDLVVAAGMALLALTSAWLVMRQARTELAHARE